AHDLLRAEAVLDGDDRRARERAFEPRGDGADVDALAGDDHELRLAELFRFGRRAHPAEELASPRDAQALALERLRVLAPPRQDAHLGDLREMGSEQASDRAGADDADPPDHAYLVCRYRT